MTELVYDEVGRLSERRFFGNFADYDNGVELPAEVWSYAYDAFGRETSVVLTRDGQPPRIETTTYDSQGRVSERESPEGIVGYEYDAAGRQTRVVARATATTTTSGDVFAAPETDTRYAYDHLGRLIEVAVYEWSDVVLAAEDRERTGYSFNLAGSLDRQTNANGTVADYDDDGLGRLDRLTHYETDGTPDDLTDNDQRLDFDYAVRADGKRIRSTETDFTGETPQVVNLTFSYDALGRLTEEDSDATDDARDYAATYTFDLNSNRLTKETDQDRDGDVDETTASTFDVNDRLLASITGDSVTTNIYDHTQQTGEETRIAGTLTSASTYDYGLTGLMTGATVTSYTSGTVSRVERVAYQQDASGTRTTEILETDTDGDGNVDSGTTTSLLNDLNNRTGYSQVLLETTRDLASGNLQRQVTYTVGLDEISQTVAEYDSNGSITNSTTLTFAHDGHGNVRAVLSANGTVVESYHFDAYGSAIGFDPKAAATRHLANGEQFDPTTGQYNHRARNYQPTTGRFFGLDPYAGDQGNPQSYQKYLYAHGDPINGIDPSGRSTLTEVGSASSMSSGLQSALLPVVMTGVRRAATGFVLGVGFNALRNSAIGNPWYNGWFEAGATGAALYPIVAAVPALGAALAVFGVADAAGVAYVVFSDPTSTAQEKLSAAAYLILSSAIGVSNTRNFGPRGNPTPETTAYFARLGETALRVAYGIGASSESAAGRIFGPSALAVVGRTGMSVRPVPHRAGGGSTPVYGQGLRSSSTTTGHGEGAEAMAMRLAETGWFEAVLIQRSWRTALDRMAGTMRSIPDVLALGRDGRVHAFEVISSSDNPSELMGWLRNGIDALSPSRQGEIRTLSPNEALNFSPDAAFYAPQF